MATIGLQEFEGSTWSEPGFVERLLDKVVTNPFGVPQTMSFDGVTNWKAYNAKQVLTLFRKPGDNMVALEIEKPLTATAFITKNAVLNSVVLRTANKNLVEAGTEEVLAYVRSLAGLLPKCRRGEISVQNKMREFYAEHNLKRLPECFADFVHWYHLISPQDKSLNPK